MDTATKWFTFAWVSVLGLLSCTLLGIAFLLWRWRREAQKPD